MFLRRQIGRVIQTSVRIVIIYLTSLEYTYFYFRFFICPNSHFYSINDKNNVCCSLLLHCIDANQLNFAYLILFSIGFSSNEQKKRSRVRKTEVVSRSMHLTINFIFHALNAQFTRTQNSNAYIFVLLSSQVSIVA